MKKQLPLQAYEKMTDAELAEAKHDLRQNLTDTEAGFIKRASNVIMGTFKGLVSGALAYIVGHYSQNRSLWHKSFSEAKAAKRLEHITESFKNLQISEAGAKTFYEFKNNLSAGKKTAGIVAGCAVGLGATAAFMRSAWLQTTDDVANNANTTLTHVERLEREHAEHKALAAKGGEPPSQMSL